MAYDYMIDDQHWLSNVEKIPRNYAGDVISVSIVVNHWTAGGSGRQSVDVLDRLGLSAHLIVERDGTIYQTAPFNRRCSHAGRSSWRGRPWVNGFSIGIEWANYGPLMRQPDGILRNMYGGLYEGPVHHGVHANGSRQFLLWEPITKAQLEVGIALHKALKARYPSLVEAVGHHEVSPGRKLDISPDPALLAWKQVFADRVTRSTEPQPIGDEKPVSEETEPISLSSVQQALNMAGHRPKLAVDGVLGPLTRDAIVMFQRRSGLHADGIVGPKTRAKLRL